MHKRKICIFTGTRADYGLLYWLMKEIQNDDDLILQTLVTGMHLSPEFGLTINKIIEDGFPISEKVEILLSADTSSAITKSMGLALIGFADALDRLKPDIMVILGDRFEALAAAQAAMVARIPIAHIHGGEITEGAIDDSIRHAITKMACLHFVSAQPYLERVKQLGENPEFCWLVGAPGLDYIKKTNFLTRSALESELQFTLKTSNYLVTFHPETSNNDGQVERFANILKAFDRLIDSAFIFTAANADSDGLKINHLIAQYVASNSDKACYIKNLGQLRYLSLLKIVDAVIGNSSSGIIEAPLLKTPTINIGLRQSGRLKAESIVDVSSDESSIIEAINSLKTPSFQQKLINAKSLYGEGNATIQILNILKSVDTDVFRYKKFFDYTPGVKNCGQ